MFQAGNFYRDGGVDDPEEDFAGPLGILVATAGRASDFWSERAPGLAWGVECEGSHCVVLFFVSLVLGGIIDVARTILRSTL
eukprot:5055867-Pyramimonas_sp.AAC.1